LAFPREQRTRHLKEIDITFCPHPTYAFAALALRRLIPGLEVVRRLPEWLVGVFETPFGEEKERHVYFADGAFEFSRERESSGYVRGLRVHVAGDVDGDVDGDGWRVVESTLQFTDFDPPFGWPSWSRYCYRPSVSLLRAPEEELSPSGERVRSVLVAQMLHGLRAPPPSYPQAAHAALVPLGESKFFTREGKLWSEGQPPSHKHIMVSRMPVRALPQQLEQRAAARSRPSPRRRSPMMPPAELVEKISAFESEMGSEHTYIPRTGERLLHQYLAAPQL